MSLTCHGDDFLVVGSISEIRWLEKEMEKEFEIKIKVLGPEVGCVQERTILNRTLRWNDAEGNIEYEPDARRAEVLIKELGLEGANGLSVPGCEEQSRCSQQGAPKQQDIAEASDNKFRKLAARLNSLALDRPDLPCTSKCISRLMVKPTPEAWKALKKVGRYLISHPRFKQVFPFGESHDMVLGHADSDWAGDKVDRKSTSGGVLSWGGHVIKTWSSTQQTLSLSRVKQNCTRSRRRRRKLLERCSY